MSGPRVGQLAAVTGLLGISAWACVNRDDIGIKGTPVSLDTIIVCIAASAVAAYVTARTWRLFPSPIVSAIAGVLFGDRLGPVGGVIGLLVGVAVVAFVMADTRLTKRCSWPASPAGGLAFSPLQAATTGRAFMVRWRATELW
jgi:hypothetical protein